MELSRFIINVSDFDRSYKFYDDYLKLDLISQWDREDSRGAVFKCGQAMVEIIRVNDETGTADAEYILKRHKLVLFFEPGDIKTTHEQLKQKPDLEVTEITKQSWGYLTFETYDPDNVKLIFAQPI